MELPNTPAKRAELLLHIVEADVREAIQGVHNSEAGQFRQDQLVFALGFLKAARRLLGGENL